MAATRVQLAVRTVLEKAGEVRHGALEVVETDASDPAIPERLLIGGRSGEDGLEVRERAREVATEVAHAAAAVQQ